MREDSEWGYRPILRKGDFSTNISEGQIQDDAKSAKGAGYHVERHLGGDTAPSVAHQITHFFPGYNAVDLFKLAGVARSNAAKVMESLPIVSHTSPEFTDKDRFLRGLQQDMWE